MNNPTDRRTLLLAAGAATVIAATNNAVAQSADIQGTVQLEDGAAIPEGHIDIYLGDPAAQNSPQYHAAKTRLYSDGGSKKIGFSVPPPTADAASPKLQIVARLEREDGWLLARGSAHFQVGAPVHITLNTVMY